MVLTYLTTNEIIKVMSTPQHYVNSLLDLGWTQQYLAGEAECSQSVISALSRGKRGKRTSYELVERLKMLYEQHCLKHNHDNDSITGPDGKDTQR